MFNIQYSIFNSRNAILIVASFVLTILISCNSTYTSKKKGYYKVDFPERKYVSFSKAGFPYTFEYPAYANIIQDTTYFEGRPENDYWVNIDFPQFGARIFLSYKIVGGKAIYKLKQEDGTYRDSAGINVFDRMVNDAFNLTNKNQVITTKITDSLMRTPNGVTGLFFKVGGNAATARQFFLSDTTKNFIRGALYFDVTPNADSLRPVQDFLQEDIAHMINTFRWTNK
jgi:gliding motility-associated lipoprotein GldD